MTVMADRSGRPAPVRRRMKTLTQAALNADKTVMSPLSVTEHAVRGVLDRLRNRTVHEPTN